MKISDVTVKQAILAIWLVFSVFYIGYDFTQAVIARGYVSGKTEMVVSLINQAKTCKPFDVFVGDQKVSLTALNCKEQGTDQATTEKK